MYISPYRFICYTSFKEVHNIEAQAAATKKYLKDIGEYKLRVSKDDKEKYMLAAKSAGMSLNRYIIQAIEEKMQRENN